MIEFKQLRCFVAVAESTSFSKAAQKLYLSQPALSQQIAKLEQQLGITLISRNSRSINLTAAGQELYRHAIVLLNEMENTVHSVLTADSLELRQETFRLILEDSIFSLKDTGAYEWLEQVRNTFPNLNITCVPNRSDGIGRTLAEGKGDLAIRFISSITGSSPIGPNLVEHCFHRGYLALAVPKSWNFTFHSPEFSQAVKGATLYYPNVRTDWHGSVIDALVKVNAHPHSVCMENYEAALNFVATGEGMFFAPEIQLRRQNSPYFNVIPLTVDSAQYRVSAIYQSNHHAHLSPILSLLPEVPGLPAVPDAESTAG